MNIRYLFILGIISLVPSCLPEEQDGPFCGDGLVNQEWEQCDSGDALICEDCTTLCIQCQVVPNVGVN